ncbi:MAG: cation:proton antiporter [Chloroflexi bacterium]|nr:cation:proton antiporter [Chloroflexota bacterium]MBL7061821.1 cation:proton antiporter [Dehalococcoidia bacterium]
MTAVQVLGFVGILLIIGFLADYLFRKTRFPDILILIVLGYLIGPVFHIVNPSEIAPASQVIASLALVVILFNGGLDLEFAKVLSSAPRALILVIVGIVVSMASTAAFAYYLMGWGFMDSLLLGAILGGTSPSIVMPLISRAKLPDEASSILSLESAFNGAIVIVVALVILEVITTGQTGNTAFMVVEKIGLQIFLGGLIGVIVGVVWLWVLTLLEGETYDDILTLAIAFLLYFIVESMNGSGVIFAITFGLMLGNGVEVAKFLGIKRTVVIHELMKKFHSQMSFLIKTFFFVYLGLMISFAHYGLILAGVALSLVLLLVRYIAVLLSSIRSDILLENKGLLTTMLPRGLSAAVVAEIVVASGIPNASIYPGVIMVVIVTTVVISAIGIPIFTRTRQKS